MSTTQDALSAARTRVAALETEAAKETRHERNKKAAELRAQGRALDRQIQAQATELRRLRGIAEPLWARLPLIEREQRQLEEAGPGEFPTDEEITAHDEKLKRLEAERQENTNRRMELSTLIALAERTLNELTAQRKLLLWQIEQV